MRPRHKAAENGTVACVTVPGQDQASMRPRHKAAENRSGFRSTILTIGRLQ